MQAEPPPLIAPAPPVGSVIWEKGRQRVVVVACASVLVVVGTSGLVHPAAGLPDFALAGGAVVVEVNPAPTPLSESATLTLRESASTALPGLLQQLQELAPKGR